MDCFGFRLAFPAKFTGLIVLLLSLLSCRPVFAIGWTELLILAIIIAFLMGPFLLRIYRAYDRLRKADKAEGKKK